MQKPRIHVAPRIQTWTGKKSRQIHDQKETLNCACGRDAPNVGQTIRSHPHRCRCPTRSGADAKIYTQAAIIIKDQMGDEPESKHFRRKKKNRPSDQVPPISFSMSILTASSCQRIFYFLFFVWFCWKKILYFLFSFDFLRFLPTVVSRVERPKNLTVLLPLYFVGGFSLAVGGSLPSRFDCWENEKRERQTDNNNVGKKERKKKTRMKREWEKKDSGHGKESVGTYYFIFVVCSLTRTGESKRKKKDDDDEKILSLFTPPNKKNQRGVTRDPENFLFHLAHNFFIFIGECKIEDRQNLLWISFVPVKPVKFFVCENPRKNP